MSNDTDAESRDKDKGLSWYLVYTRPQQERVARENLERQGYQVYLPLLKKRIRRGRQFHYRIDPLFPRYLFIRLSMSEDDWGPIRSTTGVTHLVRFGNQAVSLPDQLVDSLKEHESEDDVHILPEKSLEQGDRVRFVDGSLSGYEAIFQCTSSSDRILVLMDIAGQHTKIQVSASSVEPIKSD